MRIRLVVCKCTAGRAAPSMHEVVGVSCGHLAHVSICATTKAWAGCWCASRALLGVVVEESGEGLRWLASANGNTRGVKSAGGLQLLCWPLVSQWQNLLWSCAEQVTRSPSDPHAMADTGGPCSSSLFLAVSIRLSFTGLWVG